MPRFFSFRTLATLARSAVFTDTPVYVQFYITARCNLTCLQCNIRYSNADLPECSLDEVKRIADNLACIGTGVVLLTGGEPFSRLDLPEIIREFASRGIHVRMQTNGLANEEAIHKVIEYGGNDISISLDSLVPETQESINGGFPGSWHRAIRAISIFTKYLPKKTSFASIGCVLQRKNLFDIEPLIQFGTRIGWYTSLVPVHTSNNRNPRGFCTFDQSLQLQPDDFPFVDQLLSRVIALRDQGFLLYDSNQYISNFRSFVRGERLTWRDRHNGVCDSPNLYFVVLPNGDLAPCCDWRFDGRRVPVGSPEFPRLFHDQTFRKDLFAITSACPGCMYGSFPEMTISMRDLPAKLQRVKTFITAPPPKPWPISYERMIEIADEIRNAPDDRAKA
jgi:sulfatase maturation enzyme AslB (radical SAM superfamily)